MLDPQTTPAVAMDPLERQAREHLAAGRWRKAREDFKQLCKKDRAKFTPLLIEANVGLVREMVGKGLVSEAQQVVAYLKTFAPAEVIRGLELQLAARSGDTTQLVPGAVALLAGGGASLPAAEKLRWADRLVVAFAPVPGQSPAELQMAEEVRAVQQGLEAISAGQNERALEAVRPLPRESVFSHWRLFIKGLAAFHAGEKEKALRCFEELPPESTPCRAREPYLLLLGKTPTLRTAEAALDAATRLTGHAGWGRWLARAETLWRGGKPVEAYRVFRDAVPAFPSEALDLSGVLSEFFFNAIFTLNEDARYACEDFFLPIEMEHRTKNAVELKLIRRTFCLLMANTLTPEELKAKWEGFVRGHEQLHGASPRLASLAYGWLGEVFARPRPAGLFGAAKPRLRDGPAALAALQQSIALDPANASAHLLLCSVYEALDMSSERNRLLDVMTERFADNKEALLLAGAGCLERKAFLKGLEYFERALTLDRLEPKIPDFIATGRLRLARQYFQKGRVEEARREMERVTEFLIEQPENFLRNPWCHWARRGLLEQLFGDAAQGAELLAQARASSPFPAVFLFFVELAWGLYAPNKTASSPFLKELNETAKANPNAAHALALVRLWSFWKTAPDAPALAEEERWLRLYLKSAAKKPFTREEAATLVELLKTLQGWAEEGLRFVSGVLKKDRKDPLFRLYEDMLQPFRLRDPESDRQHLESVLAEATRRGDEKAAKLARQLLAELHTPPPLPVEPEWDEEAEDEEVQDFPLPPLPGMSPGDMTSLLDMLGILAMLPEADIRRIRKSRPKDMPAEVFDLLVAAAREGKPLPPFPPLPGPQRSFVPPAPPPRPQSQDPNQMNLF